MNKQMAPPATLGAALSVTVKPYFPSELACTFGESGWFSQRVVEDERG